MRKESWLLCPCCKTHMQKSHKPDYSRTEEMFVRYYYECPKCFVTAISNRGDMYYYSADGKPMFNSF